MLTGPKVVCTRQAELRRFDLEGRYALIAEVRREGSEITCSPDVEIELLRPGGLRDRPELYGCTMRLRFCVACTAVLAATAVQARILGNLLLFDKISR